VRVTSLAAFAGFFTAACGWLCSLIAFRSGAGGAFFLRGAGREKKGAGDQGEGEEACHKGRRLETDYVLCRDLAVSCLLAHLHWCWWRRRSWLGSAGDEAAGDDRSREGEEGVFHSVCVYLLQLGELQLRS
jgi:hypothetical protein